MTKFFTIRRIQQAIEHLQQFQSKWIIVPLVFAVNGVNEIEETYTAASGQAGTQKFLDEYFHGSLIGLAAFDNGKNTLRPRFADTYPTMVSEGHENDYVLHQRVNLWGSHYSSRGYREMRLSGLIEGEFSKFKINSTFWDEWAKNLPASFRFEELLVWLYAFHGFPESINSWGDLFRHFQERYLGSGGTFPKGFEARFNVNTQVAWPKEFLSEKPPNASLQHSLIPSKFLPVRDPENTVEPLEPMDSLISDDDPRLLEVLRLLEDGYAGIIFTGPPGTSKTWYAEQIAAKLVDLDSTRTRFIQFHASYQYEDFVEGYVPKKDGSGFSLEPKHFLDVCDVARKANGKTCVLVIDELSRCDPSRVFGEVLTYIETSNRGKLFKLASGNETSIPSNLVVLATMNPLGRGVDEVDAALERRFAKIAMDPDPVKLREFLEENGMENSLSERVQAFFARLLKNRNVQSRIGHAYFRTVRDEEGLRRLWDNQLRFHFEKAFRLSSEGFSEIEREWQRIFAPPAAVAAPADEAANQEGPA
jgi:5-methylcytosine-specific restriction enzyme B